MAQARAKSRGKLTDIRQRIVEVRMLPISQLKPSPENWRIHGDSQRAVMADVLKDIGWAGAELVWVDADGELRIIDGHLREDMVDMVVPVLVSDLTEEEARRMMAVHDPVAAMAGTDVEKYRDLVAGIDFGADAVNAMCAEIAAGGAAGDIPPDALKEMPTGDAPLGDPELMKWGVVVEVDDEEAQVTLLERLAGEGFRVKALMT